MSEYVKEAQQLKAKNTDARKLQKVIQSRTHRNILRDIRIRYKGKEPLQLQKHNENFELTSKNIDYPAVIQAYSIEWGERMQIINSIELDRPPISVLNAKVLFPKWDMSSSHTTPFVVIKRILELRLQGKTFYQALSEIKQLTCDIRSLPGYKVMPDDEKANIDSKISEICGGIKQLLDDVQPDVLNGLNAINRNMLITGYAEAYFICRNSIYYTFHVAGNGGGADGEAEKIRNLECAANFDDALGCAVNLLDKNYCGNKEDFLNIARQHFLSIASLFDAMGNRGIGNKFKVLANKDEEMLRAFKIEESEVIYLHALRDAAER